MTRLGEYFARKSVNKADVSRKTGISKPRLSELSNKANAKPRAEELYLIALAIDVSACELLEFICKDISLKSS